MTAWSERGPCRLVLSMSIEQVSSPSVTIVRALGRLCIMQTLISPHALPTAPATSLKPLFERLLELHDSTRLEQLANECQEATTSLPETDKPQTYEGLLDVARYCIEEDPGWKAEEKAQLLGGHPRIGAKAGTMSSTSEKEQKANEDDAEADRELARLNFIYEQRFTQLRYVTYVAGRPRKAIAKELEELLHDKLSSLQPPPIDDVDKPSAEAIEWAGKNVQAIGSGEEEWQRELDRGLDALFDIAMDRASKITEQEYTAPPRTTPFIDENEVFDEPFLTLDTFKKLVKESPLLETFFTVDLPSSFYLVPPPPPQETTREALATLAAVAVTGGGGGDATRKRVKGLLGGLWGDLTDRAGKVTGRETRTGPRPAFGREEILRGEEMRAKGSKQSGVAQDHGDHTNTDITDAEESLKLATQRLTDIERGHFVIDEPAAAGDGDDADGDEDFEDATVDAQEELGLGMERLGIEDGAQVEEAPQKDREIAKGEQNSIEILIDKCRPANKILL